MHLGMFLRQPSCRSSRDNGMANDVWLLQPLAGAFSEGKVKLLKKNMLIDVSYAQDGQLFHGNSPGACFKK
jgi:hypothetical protein